MQKKTYTNICVSDFMHKLMFDWFSSFFYRQCIILEIVFVDINSIELNHAVGRIEQNSGSFSTNNIGHRFILKWMLCDIKASIRFGYRNWCNWRNYFLLICCLVFYFYTTEIHILYSHFHSITWFLGFEIGKRKRQKRRRKKPDTKSVHIICSKIHLRDIVGLSISTWKAFSYRLCSLWWFVFVFFSSLLHSSFVK